MSEEATELRPLHVPSELLASILRQAAPATQPLTIHNASVADDRSGSRRPGLTEQHPAYPILLAKVTEVALRSVCTQFRAVLPLSQARLLNVDSHRNAPRRETPHRVRAGTNVWLPEDVVLSDDTPTVLAYEVRADNSQSECIGAFSSSRVRWAGGGTGEDALTWYAAPHRHDFTFRTRMYDFLHHIARHNRVRLPHAQWALVRVELTTTRAAYWVGGQLVAEADLTREGTRRATLGWFGMVTYTSAYSWRNAVILQRPVSGESHM